jgi:hypothetical protein
MIIIEEFRQIFIGIMIMEKNFQFHENFREECMNFRDEF